MNSFSFIIHINIVTMGRIRQASVLPLQIWNEINNILNWYKYHQSLSSEEVIRAILSSYHQINIRNQNIKANLEYNKILQLRRKLCQLIIRYDTHPNDVNGNDKHPNNINNIDTNKKSDVRNNYTLYNDVNSSNTNSNNFNNNR